MLERKVNIKSKVVPVLYFGRGGEEKNSEPLPGIETPIIQPIAQRYTTELSRFHIEHIISVSKSMWLRSVDHVARMVETRNTHKIILRDNGVGQAIKLKVVL
jgi:hypothetical protein